MYRRVFESCVILERYKTNIKNKLVLHMFESCVILERYKTQPDHC